jgi:FkbM family methyltransferase
MKGSLKILMIRISFIKYILKIAGFDQIRGHWIYCRTINNNSTVIDLGANEGKFSKEISERFNAKCYAVEPGRSLFDKIPEVNIAKFNYAITGEDGPVHLYISNNHEASSVIKGFENKWGNKDTDVVDGITWNSLVDLLKLKNKTIHILKVDIEGSEIDLIKSFNITNLSNVEQITIEFHDWLNQSLYDSTVEAIKKLVSLNFITVSNTPGHSWPVEMLFLNKRLIRFNLFQKQMICLYKKVTFLKY